MTGRRDKQPGGRIRQPHFVRMVFGSVGRIQMMPRPLTADDIIPLVASLPDAERIKLLRWIALPHGTDASSYSASPPTRDEFSGDDEPIAWEADGWDEFR
jgi:hypothetical protein